MNNENTQSFNLFTNISTGETFLIRIPIGEITIGILEVIINGEIYIIYNDLDEWRESNLLLANPRDAVFFRPFIIFNYNIPLIYTLICNEFES